MLSKSKKVDNSKTKKLPKAKETKTTRAKAKSKIEKEKETSQVKSKKSVAKKAETKKTTTTKKATTQKSTKKTKKKEKLLSPIIEYYDLPYRYNETIVKVLYQTPNTLFVYWDISDTDRENYIKQYGENFFNITRPVLIIHNDTMNYSFEVPINDFANCWYLRINDSKCNYRVELGRKPNYYNTEASEEISKHIHTDYIYVSTSNNIETPNDRVLFTTNENNTIKFKNVKNNTQTTINLYEIIKKLPNLKKQNNIPYISENILKEMYSGIYENKDIKFFDKITNPTSGNPSSRMMPKK